VAVSDFKEFYAEHKNIRKYAASVYPWLVYKSKPERKGDQR
jgi:hypothetical protein